MGGEWDEFKLKLVLIGTGRVLKLAYKNAYSVNGYSIVLEKDREEKEMYPVCVKIGFNSDFRGIVGEDLFRPQMYRRLESKHP